MLVVNKITDVTPNKVINVNMEVLGLPSLADPSFNIPGKIDLLLGAEVFYELLRPGQFRDLNSSLLLQNTVFGYVASGSVDEVKENKVHCELILDVDLNRAMRKFWEIENVDNEVTKSQEALLCEKHFVKTHRRNEEGRYVLTMPLKEDPSCLGHSKDIAVKRLNSLWNRLSNDSDYLSLYLDFMRDSPCDLTRRKVDETTEPSSSYYIPHHGIFRPEKSTTKLRVVFNASSPTTNGISLNDILMKGEVIEDDITTITGFRRHKFAFTADI
ncbi:uncharacterized protein LOC129960329 [Argiope bruennichi]|uniref:uncharacterized protein LOC129960329 n=1 Tax=Argiope bruennichi TaxID=94029 RepID=UPI002494277C|nr:uncharacterized protein LOC129960329 [Argiope bruennichi]